MRDLIGKDTRNAAFDQLLGVLGEQILDDCFLATFGVDLRKLYEQIGRASCRERV